MAASTVDLSAPATDLVTAWLTTFARALEQRDAQGLAQHFSADGYWKDILSFTGGYRTFAGPDEIGQAFAQTLDATAPRSLCVSPSRTQPRRLRRAGRDVVEAYLDFDTRTGSGTAFVRLLATPDQTPQIWILLTTLQTLHGFEERVGERRPTGIEFSQNFSGDNWLDQRMKSQRYDDRDPEVVIVGGGHSGLILGARLKQMDVDALVVERTPRVGDGWRNRYHSLTLHNEVWANSMPYIPFPATWPTYLPKDKLAGWLEAYAEAMELNVWTGTRFVAGQYNHESGSWEARLATSEGERRVHPKHLVLATGGTSGVPNMPSLPGLEDFFGSVTHSGSFTSGTAFEGQHVVVVGTGTSGHDVAQDLYENGAHVTIVQRSPTCVVSLEPSGQMVYSVYSEGIPAEDVDLITAAIPYPVLTSTYQHLSKRMYEFDGELLGRLEARGFDTTYGEDDTGFHMMFLRKGGGYYINVGCSELIADGKICLLNARELDSFTPTGLRLANGETIPCDHVVLATGYQNLQEGVREFLGDEVADRVGPIWGFDENYVMRNMWQRTAQEGLWFMGGALMDARLYSRFLALQIKVDLEGTVGAPM